MTWCINLVGMSHKRHHFLHQHVSLISRKEKKYKYIIYLLNTFDLLKDKIKIFYESVANPKRSRNIVRLPIKYAPVFHSKITFFLSLSLTHICDKDLNPDGWHFWIDFHSSYNQSSQWKPNIDFRQFYTSLYSRYEVFNNRGESGARWVFIAFQQQQQHL